MFNPYKSIDTKLQEQGYFFSEEITINRGGETCTGLSCYTAPIVSDKRLKEVKEIVGSGYDVHYNPNSQNLYIKIKE